MKNAYVTVDHHGDNGTVRVGTVLLGLSDHRFGALERQRYVREASDAEVAAAEAGMKAAPSAENSDPDAPPNKAAPRHRNKAKTAE